MSYLKEYEICQANAEEWARYHAIYRLSNFNEWMSLSFQGDINRYTKIDFCYWVIKDKKRVGGALIKPNLIKCIFTIPPFNKKEDLIKALTLYDKSISDKKEVIIIPDVDLESIDCYNAAGFKLQRVEKLMVCATSNFDIIWDDQYKVVIPEHEYAEEMAELYYETYRKNKLISIASEPYDFQVENIKIYFNHIESMNVPRDWSTLIYDNAENKLIGACTVSLVNGLPYILDFVVHPEFQRKGLATNIMKRTLDVLANSYPAIRLNVTVGNDAEIFYDKMGFVSLAKKGNMEL
ncbi:GNAT family N-acetyltransferase [Oceanirhabdus seepicola]|uniref:GNAT family N-acetyltransferase n=1 Tax=Oceanirhabdus seepicola TaxID=2828781 RepID=A0A9J6P986_9CLOT|nr:GNAT family N-acetyltransferase [Oceanirhabdus seepicola]MCM1992855.1 GNAT family N-acetyltransferase [Oceanirhabdus seepicola]